LQRYPEVKRVSSRFNDGKSENNLSELDLAKESERERKSFPINGNESQQQLQKRPVSQQPNLVGQPQPSTTNNSFKTTTLRTTPQTPRPTSPSPPPARPQTPLPTRQPTQPPIIPTAQPPPRSPPQTPPPPRPPKQPPTRLAPPPSKPIPPSPNQPKATPRPTIPPVRQTVTPVAIVQQDDTTQIFDFPDYSPEISNGKGGSKDGNDSELSSDDYSYLYYEEYYEELVPEHHRFLQLEASNTNPKNGNRLQLSNSSRNPKSQKGTGNGNNLLSTGKNVKVKKVKANRTQNNNKNNNDGNFSFFHQKDEGKKSPPSSGNSFPNFPLAGFAPTQATPIIQVTLEIIKIKYQVQSGECVCLG